MMRPCSALVVALAGLLAAALAVADPGGADSAPWAGMASREYFTRVKLFDFLEATDSEGNYGDVPKHWVKLSDAGLPAYATGEFDWSVGHAAEPSFRLHTELESVGFEYQYPDLDIIEGADYLVTGWVRAVGLQESRAFVVAYYVDRFGEPIDASKRVSELIRSVSREAADEPWQRVSVLVSGRYPQAHSLRLQVWVMQRYVWHDPPPGTVDPIIRQDVNPTAWFDDLAVYRLPRAELRLAQGVACVRPETPGALLVDVHNSTTQRLGATVWVTDGNGAEVHRETLEVAPHTTVPSEIGLPVLPPEEYTARMRLMSGEEVLLERALRFVVLNDLGPELAPHIELGVDIGSGRLHDVRALTDLLGALRCGTVRVGIPMVGALDAPRKTLPFVELGSLVRELTARRISVVGVAATAEALDGRRYARSTRNLVAREPGWRELFSPVLAQHLGGVVATWQLGWEMTEAAAPPWEAETVAEVEQHLRRFTSVPQILLPQTILEPIEDGPWGASILVPADVATAALPNLLEPFTYQCESPRWLSLEWADATGLDRTQRLTDLARRMVIAKALDPDRLIMPAPLELSQSSGAAAWQPTEGFLALRTLGHYLGGKRGVGAIALEHDGVALVFDGPGESCVVYWTWRPEPQEVPVELYLGDEPREVDLWGRSTPVVIEDGKAVLRLEPMPKLLTNVDASLALLQSSFHIDPTYVQVHDLHTQPVLSFRNFYDHVLEAHIVLAAPSNWAVNPEVIDVRVGPGELCEVPLTIDVPQRQVASRQVLAVEMEVQTPVMTALHFEEPMTVGLRDVLIEATARWEGEALVIEETLHNLSDEPVSFAGSCDVPLRRLREVRFAEVPPGAAQTRTFVYRDARVRELAEMQAFLRLREIGGDREHNQLVKIPR